MSAQVCLPALCSACQRLQLLLVASGQQPMCPKCSATATIVPGESYTEDDVPLFDRVAAAVDADLRTLRVAQKIVADLRGAQRANERPELVLLRITDELPALRFLIPSLYTQRPTPAHRFQLVRGMGMVLTIVSARLRSLEAVPVATQRPPCGA